MRTIISAIFWKNNSQSLLLVESTWRNGFSTFSVFKEGQFTFSTAHPASIKPFSHTYHLISAENIVTHLQYSTWRKQWVQLLTLGGTFSILLNSYLKIMQLAIRTVKYHSGSYRLAIYPTTCRYSSWELSRHISSTDNAKGVLSNQFHHRHTVLEVQQCNGELNSVSNTVSCKQEKPRIVVSSASRPTQLDLFFI